MVTHAVVVGMTGSGKTGLLTVMIEEGRLQTDADRERVVDGLGDTGPDATMTKSDVSNVIKKLAPRWFLLRDAHAREGMMLLQPRWAMTLMLGPMTRTEIKRARELAEGRAEIESVKENAPVAVTEG